MSDPSHPQHRVPQEHMHRVVIRAMAELAPRRTANDDRPHAAEAITGRMIMAVLDPDPTALPGLTDHLLAAEVPALMIAERFVPAVARHLGEGWVCDELNFAAVSQGSARLQSLLRRLDADFAISYPALLGQGDAFLVGVPDGVQHTLGASVLTAQLRHRGHPVDLDLTLTPESLTARLRARTYGGVFISASGAANLGHCRALVQSAHKARPDIPVILGGTILDHDPHAITITGADFATTDIDAAVRFCAARPAHQASKPLRAVD